MVSRQELETLEATGAAPSPLLSPAEAVALVRRGDRSAGALTYGWPTRAHPDPTGERLAILRRALVDHPHIEAIFWE